MRISPALLTTIRLIGEHKGRQDLYSRTAPAVLETLLQGARIQSVESSNRIEGITAPPPRLRALVDENTEPRNRSEAEIASYCDVLDSINASAANMKFTPGLVLQLHRDLCRFAPDPGGRWKNADNVIEEQTADGQRRVRFTPVPAFQTPEAMEALHTGLSQARGSGEMDSLILMAAYCLDFLCINPFLDGNGRMPRLLMLVLLFRDDYEVGRYVSLERLIEETRDTYYAALEASSAGWHDGDHDLLPWVEYLMGVVLAAYRELDERVGAVAGVRGAKREMVIDCIECLPDEFSIGDIERVCPSISRPTINRALRDLRRDGRLQGTRGRDARWTKIGADNF
jgi:Fic family protein